MKKYTVFIIAFFLGISLFAQVTFRLISLPANTPANAQLYIAGSFNGWNPGAAAGLLNETIDGSPAITLNISGTITCKFTRGNWATVEGDANGNTISNRQYTVAAFDTVNINILSWEDLGGNTSGGTALSTVSVLSQNFAMPQLNRTRRIWICLPIDYQTALEKEYPVVYMHDGQNLFNNQLSFAGEWGIDETMRDLQLAGDRGAIVIGIDNGGAERLNELSPWVNPNYGGGSGEAYTDFIKNTLKPYVDANFRTLTDRLNTAIAGSSMGGLLSMYAAARYPETFGKAGILSPAFWFSDSLNIWLNGVTISSQIRTYFVAGTTESSSMLPNINEVKSTLIQKGINDTNLRVITKADGQHSEWFWRREFPDLYKWLFKSENTPASIIPVNQFNVKIQPSPFSEQLELYFPKVERFNITINDISGKTVTAEDSIVGMSHRINTSHLQAGIYIIQVNSSSGARFQQKVIKN
jgi:metallo-beta-lactamase class B